MLHRFSPLLVLALAAGGCRFGASEFSTDLDALAFDPSGTVFSYLDAHDKDLVEDTDPRVAVALTWIVFDPASDLSDKDGASLAAMAHEMELRDALSIVFDHQGSVDKGEVFTVVKEGDDIVDGDGMDFRLHLAPERLYSNSSYEEIIPLGSRRTLEVTIDEASFDEPTPVVAGTVTLKIEAIAGRDIGKARDATIEGSFVAPLVVERTAEKNLALLEAAADLDVLALPLPPRSAP